MCLSDFVPKDSPARQIDKFVDEMDTSYFVYATTKETGRPAYNPKDMLKLYLYGLDNAVVSSRKLEKLCVENIVVMWLIHGLKPESKTICNFRKDNAENLKRFFNEFAKKLAEAGLIDGKVVGIDGTKIRANNSKKRHYTRNWLAMQIERTEKRIAEYITELDKNDVLERLQAKREKLFSYKEKLDSGEVDQVALTDPESRMMQMSNGGYNIGYNAQAAVDGKNKLIAGFDIATQPSDHGLLYSVAKDVKDNLAFESMTVVADKGYYKMDDIKSCHDDNIETLVSITQGGRPSKKLFHKSQFAYDEQTDTYTCPQGHKLSFSELCKSNNSRVYKNWLACQKCPVKSQCTKSRCRTVSHHNFREAYLRNYNMLENHKDIYRLRCQLCEHPFGIIKSIMGYTQFLTRGTRKVTAELAMIFTSYNLKRLRNIA